MTLPGPNPRADAGNIALLLWLYLLQGLPMGLSASVSMLMAARGAGFAEQATFALCNLPFSFKLLWAPAVDALYTARFGLGRRKTWIVPTQFAIGAILCILAVRVDALFGAPPEAHSGVAAPIDAVGLGASFFALYLLCATQDIAVDAWALVLLRPENVGYASTTNAIGQMLGISLGNSLLVALNSAAFCDAYVRAPLGLDPTGAGLVSVGAFMWALGAVFAASTALLWALKPEVHVVHLAHPHHAAEGGAVEAGEKALGSETAVAVDARRDSAPEAAEAPAASESDAAAPLTTSEGGAQMGRRSPHRPRSPASQGARRRMSPRLVAAAGRVNSGSGGGPPSDDTGSEEGDPLLQPKALAASAGGRALAVPVAAAAAAGRRRGGGAAPSPAAAALAAPVEGAGEPDDGDGSLASAWASLVSSYGALARLLRLRSVLRAAAFLLSAKLAFTAVDSSTAIVMQSKGLSPEALSSFSALSTPLLLVAQVAASRLTAGPRPLSAFMAAYPLRLAAGLLLLALLYGGGMGRPDGGGGMTAPGWGTTAALLIAQNALGLIQTVMFLAQMSFFARVADPSMGGTYMTLLNTLSNLGGTWPLWIVMRGIGALTDRVCVPRGSAAEAAVASAGWLSLLPPGHLPLGGGGYAPCPDAASAGACVAAGGHCATVSDGYLLAVLASTALGVAWWLAHRGPLERLETLPRADWLAAAPQAPPAATGAPAAAAAALAPEGGLGSGAAAGVGGAAPRKLSDE